MKKLKANFQMNLEKVVVQGFPPPAKSVDGTDHIGNTNKKGKVPMKQKPTREPYHGGEVWVNPTADAIRYEECLCLNCALLDKENPDNCCPTTNALYQICRTANLALLVVHCPDWKPKPE